MTFGSRADDQGFGGHTESISMGRSVGCRGCWAARRGGRGPAQIVHVIPRASAGAGWGGGEGAHQTPPPSFRLCPDGARTVAACLSPSTRPSGACTGRSAGDRPRRPAPRRPAPLAARSVPPSIPYARRPARCRAPPPAAVRRAGSDRDITAGRPGRKRAGRIA